MTGTRVPDGSSYSTSTPRGAYWRDASGAWCIVTPYGRLGSLAQRTVTEHEDGTITVSPSILMYAVDGRAYEPPERDRLIKAYGLQAVKDWEGSRPAYHGFLERGVWREC